jgi:hypothetical protein
MSRAHLRCREVSGLVRLDGWDGCVALQPLEVLEKCHSTLDEHDQNGNEESANLLCGVCLRHGVCEQSKILTGDLEDWDRPMQHERAVRWMIPLVANCSTYVCYANIPIVVRPNFFFRMHTGLVLLHGRCLAGCVVAPLSLLSRRGSILASGESAFRFPVAPVLLPQPCVHPPQSLRDSRRDSGSITPR